MTRLRRHRWFAAVLLAGCCASCSSDSSAGSATTSPRESAPVVTAAEQPSPTDPPVTVPLSVIAEACAAHAPQGAEFVVGEETTALGLRRSLGVVVTAPPAGTEISGIPGVSDPDVALQCWGRRGDGDTAAVVVYFVGPSGETGVGCSIRTAPVSPEATRELSCL